MCASTCSRLAKANVGEEGHRENGNSELAVGGE